MGEQFTSILDVTIAYDTDKNNLWHFWCGKVKKISIHITKYPVSEELLGQDYENDDIFDELHDICKDWFGEDLITDYYEECGGQEHEEEEDFMFMESAFADEIDEVDVSGSQGIYGEMEPPYDFDSEGPGKAGPYQRTSYNEEMEDEDSEEEFEIDEDLKESFMNQKEKVIKMMNRMKIIK